MAEPTPYDVVPYTSYPYPRSHPDRLHVVGTLFGMSPAPVTSCRVLELGCASGGNLIPMACHLPEAEFVGIDLATRHIEPGRKMIEELGLENVRLELGSILEVDASWGAFDYVICHGVYSWVNTEVREKILSICSDLLRPQGIAYISYNTYPGWHMREMVRHMMCYHVAQFEEPRQRVAQARALIDFLARFAPTESSQGVLLKEELDLISRVSDDYLYHDFLEELNEPLYFHQFAEQARAHRLQYLGEAEFHTMLAKGLPDEVEKTLGRIAHDITAFEQYMDFVRNRSFRCTLLCHEDVALARDVAPERLTDLRVASALKQVDEPGGAPGEVAFRTPSGRHARTADPATKAAFHVLSRRWPEALPFRALAADVAALSKGADGRDGDALTQHLAAELLFCHSRDVVELHSWTPPIRRRPPERPRAPLIARLQASRTPTVTNLRHEAARLDPVTERLLPMLDGETSRRELVERLAGLAQQGALDLERRGQKVRDPAQVRELLEEVVSDALDRLGQMALLEG